MCIGAFGPEGLPSSLEIPSTSILPGQVVTQPLVQPPVTRCSLPTESA